MRYIRRSAKTKWLLTHEICDNYKKGKYSIESCCKNSSVPERTFQHWISTSRKEKKKPKSKQRELIAELATIYDKAKSEAQRAYYNDLRENAKRSLHKLVEGFQVTERKTTYHPADEDGERRVKEIVETVKNILPSATAVIFALTNVDANNFKHRNQIPPDAGGTVEGNKIKLPDGTEIDV
jgi:hypothetical protein